MGWAGREGSVNGGVSVEEVGEEVGGGVVNDRGGGYGD